MRRYAVKLGDIELVSSTPITQAERAEAIKLVEDAVKEMLGQSAPEGLTVRFMSGAL